MLKQPGKKKKAEKKVDLLGLLCKNCQKIKVKNLYIMKRCSNLVIWIFNFPSEQDLA